MYTFQGSILSALIKKVHATGGVLTAADFIGYTPLVKPALKGTYKNRTVYTTHAPTSGPVLLHMLNLLERFDMSGADEGVKLHRFVETMKCERINMGSCDILNPLKLALQQGTISASLLLHV